MTESVAGRAPATPPRDAAPPAEALLALLTAEQAQAVRHGPGPLLIVAGPGTGKTRTLTHRVAHLLATGRATAREVLAVPFSVRAAGELRLRLADLLGEDTARGVLAATFHSVCARLLREHATPYGRTDAYSSPSNLDRMRRAANPPFPRWLGFGTALLAAAVFVASLLGASDRLTFAAGVAVLVGCTAEIVLCVRHLRREADRRLTPPSGSGSAGSNRPNRRAQDGAPLTLFCSTATAVAVGRQRLVATGIHSGSDRLPIPAGAHGHHSDYLFRFCRRAGGARRRAK